MHLASFFFSLILALVLSNKINAKSIGQYKNTLEYLETFGYLSKGEKDRLFLNSDRREITKRKVFVRALRDLQENGNLKVTGKLDKPTLQLMKTPRCGVPDKIHRSRKKRYDLMSTKWQKTDITWSFNDKNGPYQDDSTKIRRALHEAFQIWQDHSTLKFQELSGWDEDVDIKLSFEKRNHPDVDPYSFSDITLAHAFQPGQGLGGDGHYREDVDWDFDVLYDNKPMEGKTSFFAVALHEIGHSLGLAHSRVSDSVMYEYYSMNTATLAEDDIRAIQFVYGVPKDRKYKPSNKTHQEDEEDAPPVWDTRPMLPDKCNTSYDAITFINGELFIFKDRYLFGPNREVAEIRSLWHDLPKDLKKIDAVFQNYEGKIYFFIGQQVFVFKQQTLLMTERLTHFGIDADVKKVDAIFRWNYNKVTYIFSEDEYWRFNEKREYVEKNFPKVISRAFNDVYDIDTAFSFENSLLFFKNENFYEFDSISMRLLRMKPHLSANKFMNCEIPVIEKIENRFGGENRDYIDLGDSFNEVIEDIDNIEKTFLPSQDEKDGACSIKSLGVLSIILIPAMFHFIN